MIPPGNGRNVVGDSCGQLAVGRDYSRLGNLCGLSRLHAVWPEVILALGQGDLPQYVHNLLYVYALRAADAALKTAGADPDGAALDQGVLLSELGQMYDGTWQKIHLLGQRATGGAVAALVAGVDLLAGQIIQPPPELAPDRLPIQTDPRASHPASLPGHGPPLAETAACQAARSRPQ